MNASGLASRTAATPLSRSSYRSNQGGGDCLSILPCEQRSLTCLKSQDGELNHPGLVHTFLIGKVAAMPKKYDEQAPGQGGPVGAGAS